MESNFNNIKWLALDYGGTLAPSCPVIVDERMLVETLQAVFDLKVPQDFESYFRELLQERLKNIKEKYLEYPLRYYINRALKKFNLNPAVTAEEIETCFFERMGDAIPYPDIKATLEALSQKGYAILLASNTLRNYTVREKTIRRADLRTFFQHLILSSEIGFKKPHEAFYRTVIETAGVVPENIVFVGDRLSNDVLAPLRAGMKAVWIGTNKRSKLPETERFLGCIEHFSEILSLI